MRPGESFVRQPVRSLQTMLRVLAEADATLQTLIPDGIYGPETVRSVTTFQRKNGLPANGVVDQQTWERIADAYGQALVNIGPLQPIEILLEPGQVIRFGDSNPYIYLLQAMLTQLSNDHPAIEAPGFSGILDTETDISIRGFQKLAGLEESGEFDRETWKNLVLQFTLSANHKNTSSLL